LIEDLNYPDNSFDAVVLLEVLEHVTEEKGFEILSKAERWARKKIIISTPNGFLPQHEVDENPHQKHLSGWTPSKLKASGFKSHGLAGIKFLRQEVEADTMGDDILTTIRFKPAMFWFAVSAFSQIFT